MKSANKAKAQTSRARARAHEPVLAPTPADVLRDLMQQTDGLTQEELGSVMRVSRYSINQLMNGRRGVTAEMALRLAAAFDTTPEFWLRLQQAADLEMARHRLGGQLKGIRTVRAGTPNPSELLEID
jgi:addiction module HigA family antidote